MLSSLIAWTVAAAAASTGTQAYFDRPQLRIETGIHNGRPTALSVDAAGRVAVTSGIDGTLRVWELPRGPGGGISLRDTFRVAQGPDSVGALYAAAISPDGRIAAVGGFLDAQGVRNRFAHVIDLSTGRVARTIRNLPESTTALAFSPDGRSLAIGSSKGGLRVFRVADGAQIASDTRYGGEILGLTFSRQGQLATSAMDGFIRLYDSQYKAFTNVMPRPSRTEIFGVRPVLPGDLAFSPDGTMLAVAPAYCPQCACVPGIFALRTTDLSFAHELTPSLKAAASRTCFSKTAWSNDGAFVFATGVGDCKSSYDHATYQPEKPGDEVRAGACLARWAAAANFEFSAVRKLGIQNTVFGLQPLGPHGAVLASAEPRLAVVDGEGKLQSRLRTLARDFRMFNGGEAGLQAFKVSADGLRIVLPGDPILGTKPLLFDLNARSVAALGSDQDSLFGPCGQLGDETIDFDKHCKSPLGYGVVNWDGDSVSSMLRALVGQAGADRDMPQGPAVGRRDAKGVVKWTPLGLRRNDILRVLTFDPSGDRFAFGAIDGIRLFDRGGRLIKSVDTPGDVWRIVFTPDSRFLVAALQDGSVRWYSTATGQELRERLAVFVAEPSHRWIAWTPEGYYDASPGAEELLGWHINRGAGQSALFYPAGRFRGMFRRPDLIDTALTADAPAPGPSSETFMAQVPPVLRILSLKPFSDGKIGVKFQIDWPDKSARQIASIFGSVNGVTTRLDGDPLSLDQDRGAIELRVPASARTAAATVSLAAITPMSAISEPASRFAGRLTPAKDAKTGTLYVLAVGVSRYRDSAYDLAFAAKDAEAVRDVVERQRGLGLYSDVRVTLLLNEQATRDGVLAAMRAIAEAEGPEDTTALYLAGHGVTQLAMQTFGDLKIPALTYYYLPYDGVVKDGSVEEGSAISQSDITFGFLGRLEGRKIVMLDTCRTSSAPGPNERGLRVEARRTTGTVFGNLLAETVGDRAWASTVFAAASDTEGALESSAFRNGHGAFTAALLDAFDGDKRFKRGGQGHFDQRQLGDWLAQRVPELTSNLQTPVRVDGSGARVPLATIVPAAANSAR